MLRIVLAFLISAGLFLANSAVTHAADTTRPTAPTGLAATVISSSQVNLAWIASTDNVGVTGYRVLRCAGSACTNFTQVGTSTVTSFSSTGLTAATTYRFRVLAFDAAGNISTNSNTVSATTRSAPDLILTKTHTGNFFQGQTGATYVLSVTNGGIGSSSGTVTVTDTLPAGLTATGIAGTGWTCTQPAGPCTRSNALAAGASYPPLTLTVNVAANAPASVTNTATVSGGSDVNTGNNSASDVTLIGQPQPPDLTLTKTHTGNFIQGQSGATYTLTVSNSGTGVSAGTATVTDTLPAGLTATGIAGTGWTCTQPAGPCTRSDVLAAGASYPPLTLTVNVAANAPASVTNTATVSGGGEVNTGNNSASDVTVIGAPASGLVAGYAFSEGTGTSTADASGNNNTGTIAGATWTTAGQLGNALVFNGTNAVVNLGNPATLQLTGSMTVSAWIRAAAFPFDDAAIVSKRSGIPEQGFQLDTTVDTGPRTIGFKLTSATGGFMARFGATTLQANQWYYVTGVYNAGAQTLDVYLNGVLNNGTLTGTVTSTQQNSAMNVNIGQRPSSPAAYAFNGTIDEVRIYNRALTPEEIQADMNGQASQVPDLTVSKTHAGNFTQGQIGAAYAVTVSNGGTGASSGIVTVTDTLPAGLTASAIAGTGWTCTLGTLTCTRSDALAPGGSYPPITLTVNVAANAPASVTNTATVSGGGEINTANNTASDATLIVQPQQPDLTLTKTHTGNFTQGQTGATYTLTVSNNGTGASNGTVTVTDTLPAGLTATGIAGTGWTCTQPAGPCTRNDLLAAGGSYPSLTLTVNVAANAPASVTNTATVSGGSDVNTGNNSASDVTLIGQPQQPDLTLTKTHTGNFTQGQTGATYTLTVSNSGTGASSGTVTVTDTLPAGLTATGIAGTGWTCTQPAGPCTRSNALAAGASYPPLTLTVNVAANAPASVTNTATVSGGSDVNTGNNSASDVTLIGQPQPPDLTLTKTHTGNFIQGQSGATYTLTVSNSGTGVSAGTATVTDTLPAGLTATGIAGTGWTCTQPAGPCTRSDVLAAGASYPPLTLTVNVAANAPASVTNTATVSGGGEVNTGNNSASDVTVIGAPASGLVAGYAFSEGTGTSTADASGNNNTGTIAGATWTTAGQLGNALVFNGTNAVVNLGNPATLQLTGSMTVSAWIRAAAFPFDDAAIVSKRSGIPEQGFQLDTTVDTGPRTIGFKLTSATGGFMARFGATTLQANQWYYVTGVYNAGAQTLDVYLNGVLNNGTLTGTVTSTQQNSAMNVNIGQRPSSPAAYAFNGTIDEVRIYNRALTPAEIQVDMVSAITGPGPAPGASLSSSTITFPGQVTGTTSSAQTVTLTNTGSAPLSISAMTLSGTNSVDFGQSNNCGTSLGAGTNCAINISFTPSATGTRTASLIISDNAPGGTQTIALSGTGVASSGLAISPKVAALTTTRTQQFTANTSGVTWLVDGIPGGSSTVGTITPSGLYTPSASAGVHTVTASASSQSVNATVYVTNNPGVFTHHNDNQRTGQNLNETVLTPANVNAANFGKLFSYTLDGIAYASPLYVANVIIPGLGSRNVVYVATEHNSVYAFDADGLSSTPLWQVNFNNPAAGVTPIPILDVDPDADIGPEVGNTGTPVIDPSTGTLYLVSRTKEVSGSTTNYVQKLHALDIATGGEKLGGPIVIQASVPGTGMGSQGNQLPFNSRQQNQRAALLLNNGVLYIAFGSHSDAQPYHGWVLGYNATTLQQTLAFNATPNGEGGGIWQSGGGLAADAAGNLYFATGDGSFSANTGGKEYGNSFVKLSPSGSVLGYFTPFNFAILDANNFDLGAGGVLLLPPQAGAHPNLLVFGGKDATVYVVDRDNPGGFNPSNNTHAVQTLPNRFPNGTPPYPGNYSTPVYFNGTVYFGPVADKVQAYALTNGALSAAPTSSSSVTYDYPGGALAISANGSSNGILWSIQRSGPVLGGQGTAPAILRAHNAANLANELYNSNQAGSRDTIGSFAAKYSVPLVVNGKVFVGSEGNLTVFGLLP